MQASASYAPRAGPGPPSNIIRPAASLKIVLTAVQEKYQMELVELQYNNELKSKFHADGVSLLDFIKNVLNANTILATSNPNGLLS